MFKQPLMPIDIESLALPFDRLDEGDTSELRELDILMDLPGIISVARLHFRVGVGYEVLFSALADGDDFSDAVGIVGHFHLIRCEPWGETESGFGQYRALYWDHGS